MVRLITCRIHAVPELSIGEHPAELSRNLGDDD
jgi:hypothetical protein